MMNELDLDELDQAVSKLMDDAGKAKPKKEKAPSPASAPAASAPSTSSTTPASDATVPVMIKSTPSQPLAIPQRKKGVAMDIVQPKAPAITPPSARAGRTAPTLHPTKPIEPEETKPADAEEPKPEPKAEAPTDTPVNNETADHEVSDEALAAINMLADGSARAAPAPDTDAEMHKSAFPDPLDVHGFREETGSHKDDEPHPEEAAKPDELKDTTMEHHTTVTPPSEEDKSEQEQGLTAAESATPFVKAAVEKRPLGAYADTKPAEDAKPEEKPETEDKLEEDSKVEAASVPVQEAPKEFDPAVVAVESSEPEFTPEAPKAEEQRPEQPQNDVVEEAAEVPPTKPAANETGMDSLRQMAIPPQYQAADKAPDQGDRPVFDTKEYHPPLAIPATTHHSRGGTIFTIVLVLLVLAAAAFAVFVITGTIDPTRLF